jgi:4-carboxymuconolactone decarboxylase
MSAHNPERPRIGPLPEAEWDDETRALVELNWSGPPPGNRNNLYRTMVRHPELYRTWHEFGRVAFHGRISPRDRQLLILRTAWLSQCRFQWAYHEPLALKVGITGEEIRRLIDGPGAPGWDERDATLLRAVDELDATSRLSDATWALLRDRFDDQQLIEIPVVVGNYKLVAYLLNSLQIQPPGDLPRLPSMAHRPPRGHQFPAP